MKRQIDWQIDGQLGAYIERERGMQIDGWNEQKARRIRGESQTEIQRQIMREKKERYIYRQTEREKRGEEENGGQIDRYIQTGRTKEKKDDV